MTKKKKRRWFRIERRKVGAKSRFRIVIFNKELFGYNSHELPRAKKRGDKRPIKHIHLPYPLAKFHIPLDLKYVRYVLSDAWKNLRKRRRKKNEGN